MSSVSAAAAGLVSYGRAGPANDDQPILFVRRIRQSKALACPRQRDPIPVTAVEKPYVLFCGALSKVLK